MKLGDLKIKNRVEYKNLVIHFREKKDLPIGELRFYMDKPSVFRVMNCFPMVPWENYYSKASTYARTEIIDSSSLYEIKAFVHWCTNINTHKDHEVIVECRSLLYVMNAVIHGDFNIVGTKLASGGRLEQLRVDQTVELMNKLGAYVDPEELRVLKISSKDKPERLTEIVYATG